MYTYTPAISPSSIKTYTKKKIVNDDTVIKLFENVLISYFYGNDISRNIRDCFSTKLNNINIIGDSGGFDVVSKNASIDPISVMNWAENNEINKQFILDIPPYKMSNTQQFGEKLVGEEFKKCMYKTAENANIMMGKKNKVKLFGVVQGETIDEITEWYNIQTKEHEFDGYALAPKPSYDMLKTTLYIMFAIENMNKKPIHILQVSGMNALPLLIYASKLFDIDITSDSASYMQGGITRAYWLPHVYQTVPIFFGKKNGFTDINISELCDCEICSKLNTHSVLSNNIGFLMSLHNLNIIKQKVSLLQGLSKNNEIFFDFIKKMCSDKTLECIKILDYMKDNGFEKTYDKFFSNKKSKSLSDFA